MRQRMLLLLPVLVLVALVVPSAAQAATSTVTLKAKITKFEAHGSSLTASGVITGTLGSTGQLTKDSAPVRFRVAAKRTGNRCNILTLNLQQLFLQLLGARVETSAINLELYAKRGAILGNLFCALTKAKIRLPRVASAMNHKLGGRPLQVMAAQAPVRTAQTTEPSCQVLNLILGPLHLDLLGLNIDLYGKTKSDPVTVTITALPGHGLLGDVLCSLSGGATITSLSALQNVLTGLGADISNDDLQSLLDSLGLSLTNGISSGDLQRILDALGLTGAAPAATG
jgi:hypothetical protein